MNEQSSLSLIDILRSTRQALWQSYWTAFDWNNPSVWLKDCLGAGLAVKHASRWVLLQPRWVKWWTLLSIESSLKSLDVIRMRPDSWRLFYFLGGKGKGVCRLKQYSDVEGNLLKELMKSWDVMIVALIPQKRVDNKQTLRFWNMSF